MSANENVLLWVLEKRDNPKFSYRLSICRGTEILFCLKVQQPWPAGEGNLFCLVEDKEDDLEVVEKIPLKSFVQRGKRKIVELDRPKNNQCDFLFLEKQYKNKTGSYHQIFWRTEDAVHSNRPKVKTTSSFRSVPLTIVIDHNTSNPWNFPKNQISTEALPVGHYGLKDEQGLKTVIMTVGFTELCERLGNMKSFFRRLKRMIDHPHPILIIEARYSDFLNPTRLKKHRTSFAAKKLAELGAFHPHLKVIYAENRKLAREWTYNYFHAITAKLNEREKKQAKRDKKNNRTKFFQLGLL